MASRVVNEMSETDLASFTKLLTKWMQWDEVDFSALIKHAHQISKEELTGLTEGTHRIRRISFLVDLGEGREQRIEVPDMKLYQMPEQETSLVLGYDLRGKVADRWKVLGSRAGLYLILNPDIIPDRWKEKVNGKRKVMLFLDDPGVRDIVPTVLGIWYDGKIWHHDYYRLDREFGEEYFSVVHFKRTF